MIRVASVPSSHPYVAATTDPSSVSLLPDPTPPGATLPGQWWPPRWLEPDYLRSRVSDFDVFHLHFGFDTTPPEVLSEVCATLATHRKPLVVTVHDLHNPHFADAAAHRTRLAVLVSSATAVITLTAGAARAVASSWRRTPTVLAHPHLLPLPEIGAPRMHRDRPVVAVHAKSLRANIDPWPVLDALSAANLEASVRLDLDEGALTSPRAPRLLLERLARYAADGVDVRVHPPFSEPELRGYLNDIDVLVLPYRFGTHSGWVELCHDAGVTAVVPDNGHFREQHRAPVFGFDTSRLDRLSLLTAVAGAIETARPQYGCEDVARRRARAAQRRENRREHVNIYRDVIRQAAA